MSAGSEEISDARAEQLAGRRPIGAGSKGEFDSDRPEMVSGYFSVMELAAGWGYGGMH